MLTSMRTLFTCSLKWELTKGACELWKSKLGLHRHFLYPCGQHVRPLKKRPLLLLLLLTSGALNKHLLRCFYSGKKNMCKNRIGVAIWTHAIRICVPLCFFFLKLYCLRDSCPSVTRCTPPQTSINKTHFATFIALMGGYSSRNQ